MRSCIYTIGEENWGHKSKFETADVPVGLGDGLIFEFRHVESAQVQNLVGGARGGAFDALFDGRLDQLLEQSKGKRCRAGIVERERGKKKQNKTKQIKRSVSFCLSISLVQDSPW